MKRRPEKRRSVRQLQPATIGWLLALALNFSACKDEVPPASSSRERLSELEAAQASGAGIETLNAAEPKNPSAMRTRVYRLSGNLIEPLLSQPGSSHTTDPFAPPKEKPSRFDQAKVALGRPDARELLENFGIEFASGASAAYSGDNGELSVTLDGDNMDLIETVMESLQDGAPKQIKIRIEIFELPAPLIPQLSDSSAGHSDHTPEWRAVLDLVERNEATAVTAIACIAGSYQRARADATSEFIHPTSLDWQAEARLGLPTAFETTQVGTVLEIDPALGADGLSIDLNFRFVHHFAPPELRPVAIEVDAADAADRPRPTLTLPVFHYHETSSQIPLLAGETRLIASWRPTGRPQYASGDLMQIAFLKAEVQQAGNIERLR